MLFQSLTGGSPHAMVERMNDLSDIVEDSCSECARLLGEYEAATFEQARIHKALDIANHLRDRNVARCLTLEAFALTSRQRRARASLAEHKAVAHQIARGASH